MREGCDYRRDARESIHGEKLEPVFDLISSDLHNHISRLKALLGLLDGEEV